MSRSILERKLRDQCGMTIAQAHLAVATILEGIENEVAAGGRYDIPRSGRFVATTIKARRWRHPLTGEMRDIAPTKYVMFRAAPYFRKKLIERDTQPPVKRRRHRPPARRLRNDCPLGI